MSRQRGAPDDLYDLTLRLWSDGTPLTLVVSRLGLSVEHFAAMREEQEGYKGRKHIAHRHYASLAHRRVHAERDAAAWLAATLDQLDRTGTRFGPDIEALFWIAQLRGEGVPSMVPDPALVARTARAGARVFIENYTLPVGDDPGVESPVKMWYPPG